MKYLLDTCVISELVARNPSDKVVEWIDKINSEQTYLSVVTIGEIQKGIQKLPDSQQKETLQEWLAYDLPDRFHERILPIDTEVMLTWGRLVGNLELQGRKMAAIDSLIAAIAQHGGLTLVTRNEDDFKHAGIPLVNPWKIGAVHQ
jgi:tRNA(fMet)-specific endonuclease VapC